MTYYERNLPHWHPPHQDIFLTWRLKGSLPAHVRAAAARELSGKRFVELDRALDRAKTGPRWLRQPDIAGCVEASLAELREKREFHLHAYAVMPNHVHLLITPLAPLATITQRLKGVTARSANRLLGFTGSHFWQDESFDHWVRNPAEWQKIRAYIEDNPVAAGLVARSEDWPWSSAKWHKL